MKSRAASNWASCFRGPRALRASSWPSTFVSRKPLQVGYPEASEFFGIALARFRPAVEVALQQAAPAVVRIDLGVLRPIHRPGGLHGVLQDDFVDHTHSLRRPIPVAANSRHSGKFPVSPGGLADRAGRLCSGSFAAARPAPGVGFGRTF